MAQQYLSDRNGWLSFTSSTPLLYITSDTPDFDTATLSAWRSEGFAVTYLPMTESGKDYIATLNRLGSTLGIGARYAIIAYGAAASVCLEHFAEPRAATSKLCALVAYYPTTIPDTHRRFTASFRVIVHLAQGLQGDGEVGVVRRPEVLGIQGKKKLVRKRVGGGIGVGGRLARMEIPCFSYEGVEAGFAEGDLDEYNAVADAVAWGRSLDIVRKGFGAEVELEKVWDANVEQKFTTKDPRALLETYTTDPTTPFVNYTPTMTGGHGRAELSRFYSSYFLSSSPPSLRMRLISRTVGVDRIVDEVYMAFRHTCEMAWILPGVKPTGEKVEVVVVSVVGMRAGKVWCERVYWDHASVLFQVGLLDGDAVPQKFRDEGLDMLPVCGSEGARKVWDDAAEPANDMIEDW